MTAFSLNEIHVTAKKATRGAGYTWGLAEEAGQAVRWLCAQGLDGCAALAGVLTRFDGIGMDRITPDTSQQIWKVEDQLVLCPLIVGTAMSDRADELRHRSFETSSVAEPSLLFAFAAYCARRIECNVSVEWSNGKATSDGKWLSVSGRPASIVDHVRMQRGGDLSHPNQTCSRGNPEPSIWETLNGFAHRTYAPATEESRLKGAGADLDDRG